MATANGSSTNGTDLSRGHAVDYTPLAVVERTAEQLASLEGCIWFDIGGFGRLSQAHTADPSALA